MRSWSGSSDTSHTMVLIASITTPRSNQGVPRMDICCARTIRMPVTVRPAPPTSVKMMSLSMMPRAMARNPTSRRWR